MTAKRIAIIGNGRVGSALARGLKRAGHEVRAIGNEPASVLETALWGEIVILAVPFTVMDSVLKEAGSSVEGKTVVDATNALGSEMQLAIGFTTSGAEELQKKASKAHVIKALNTVFAQHMDTGRLGDQELAAFITGNDTDGKNTVLEMARNIGFDAVDAGPLSNARLLESLGYFNIQLAYTLGMGTQSGLKFLHGLKTT